MVSVFPIKNKMRWNLLLTIGLCSNEFADKLLSYVVRSQFEGMSARYKDILKYLNMGFTIMFSIECTLKLIGCGKVTSGQGCLFYFSFLTCLQLTGIIIHFVNTPSKKKRTTLHVKINQCLTKLKWIHIDSDVWCSIKLRRFNFWRIIVIASWAFKCWWNVWSFCIHL